MKPERTIPHLELRPSGYFWRRRMPKSPRFDPPPIFRISLRTNDGFLASVLARRLTRLSSLLFEAAGSAQMNTSEMHSLITETLAREVREADRQHSVAPPRTRAEALAEQAHLDALVASLKEAILLRDYSLVHDLLRATARDLGIAADESSLAWRSAAHQTVRGLLDVTQDRMARDRGEFSEPSAFFRSARAQARPEAEVISFAARPAVAPAAFASQALRAGTESTFPAQRAIPAAFAIERAAVAVAPPAPMDPQVPSLSLVAVEPVLQALSAAPLQEETAEPEAMPEADPEIADEMMAGISAQEIVPTAADQAPIPTVTPPSERVSFSAKVASDLAEQAKSGKPDADAVAQALAVLAAHRGPSPRVRDVAKGYIAHLKAGYAYNRPATGTVPTGELDEKQQENARSTLRLFLAYIGDKNMDAMTMELCAEFFTTITRLPNTLCRSGKKMCALENGKITFDAVIAEADEEEKKRKAEKEAELRNKGHSEGNIRDALHEIYEERLSANTIYRKMQELKRFFGFAVVMDIIEKNPMDNVIWSTKDLDEARKAEGDRTRKIWGDDLSRLLRTPLFATKLMNCADPLFWAVMIAIYTGMRLEEILQLRTDDFQTLREIWFINVSDSHGRRLKNEAARRRIPIHSFLIGLGLLELVEMRIKEGEAYLFPWLERNGRGNLGSKVSNDFTEYRKKHDLYEKRKDHHSLRKGFNQRMIDLNVPAEIRYALMGHTNNDVNIKHYSDGFPIETLKEAVEKIDFDCSMVLKPFATEKADNVTRLLLKHKVR